MGQPICAERLLLDNPIYQGNTLHRPRNIKAQQRFIRGAPPQGPTLCPLIYTLFDRKGTPFVYLLLANGTPFTYLLQSFAFFLTAVNAVFKNMNNYHKIRTSIYSQPLGPFHRPKRQISLPFYILQLVNSLSFQISVA